MTAASCAWCAEPFPPATIGGRRKRFCSTLCRRVFHSAARRWAERQFFEGKITARDLNAVSSTCTLQGIDSESRGLPTYPSGQDSPAGFLAASGGISVLWAMPDGVQLGDRTPP